MNRGPSWSRSVKTRTTFSSAAPQYRSTLELRPKFFPTDFCTTLVLNTDTMEASSYFEQVRLVPRTVPVRHGETVFSFAKEPRTLYKSTVVYDNRASDYWYTSSIDFAPIDVTHLPLEESADDEETRDGSPCNENVPTDAEYQVQQEDHASTNF